MGTKHFLFALCKAQAMFVIRQHGTPSWQPLDELRLIGTTETGTVFEQPIRLQYEGETKDLRRVVVRLKQPTRDRDSEMAILTNLPPDDADAVAIAEIYRQRWSIETLFQVQYLRQF